LASRGWLQLLIPLRHHHENRAPSSFTAKFSPIETDSDFSLHTVKPARPKKNEPSAGGLPLLLVQLAGWLASSSLVLARLSFSAWFDDSTPIENILS
jgi:hypothetical protein